jgi:thiol-disulfide isomerase/thioredoxin
MRRTPKMCWLLPFALSAGISSLAADSPQKPNTPSQSPAPKAGADVPEVVEMLRAIVNETPIGPNFGWFHPGETKHGWPWLERRYDKNKDGAIAFDEFNGPELLFDRLDRDRDGAIKPEDLDWSERSPFVQQTAASAAQFRRLDTDVNGRISRDEWGAFFDRATKEQPDLAFDDFREVMSLPPAPRRINTPAPARLSTDIPTKDVLLKGLARGEVGNYHEGPRVGDPAPDFTLSTHDKKEKITLSQYRGRPVVLVFGSVTCGPFRSRFAAIDRLQKRYGDQARFLMVYVREAHPTEGWRMESNDRVGVVADQPTVFEARAELAGKACTLMKATMPVVVDEIDDRVDDAYSGVPSRHYVIDAEGKVAYKGGRGPFGFKPGELEQALVMTLLDQESKHDQESKKADHSR